MIGLFGRAVIALGLVGFTIAEADARITHIEIIKTEPAFGGQSFGDAGAYEHLTGRVTGELDPADPEGVAGGVADRNALSSPGDGWLMRAGYTMAWFDWEMDVRPGMSRIGMPPIVAHNHNDFALTGIARSEIITPVPVISLPISLSQ